MREPGWAVAAVLPASIGVMLLIARPVQFQAELASDRLIVHSTGEDVPYAEILQVIRIDGAGWRTKVHLVHQRGELTIPAVQEMASDELYHWLVQLQPARPPAQVHRALEDYHRRQLETFGAEQLAVHVPRVLTVRLQGGSRRLLWLAMLVTALGWGAAAAVLREPGWAIAAIVLGAFIPGFWALESCRTTYTRRHYGQFSWLLLLGPIGWAIWGAQRSSHGHTNKKLQGSSLVITPAGFGLAQAELQGQLRWSEVRNVRLRKPSWLAGPAVEVFVDGAKIEIVDIYERPLSQIHDRIVHYWKSG